MKYSNDIQGTIKLQKFYFRIKLAKFFVTCWFVCVCPHALFVVSELVVCRRRYHESPIHTIAGQRPNTAGTQGLQSRAGNVSRTAQIRLIRVSK